MVVINGVDLGRKYTLTADSMVLGRSGKAQIQVDEGSVSRSHAAIEHDDGRIVIRDLNSTNGTYVNGRAVDERVLEDGDRIQVGATMLKFLAGSNLEASYHEEIYRLTTTDSVTQIYNKRFFEQELERELSRCVRYRRELSLAMLDIDHFKPVNDVHGHVVGDRVLRQCAQRIERLTRREDVLARFGGEEFSLLLPEVPRPDAVITAEKIRAAVEAEPFVVDDAQIRITLSVGVADIGEYLAVCGPIQPDGTLDLDVSAFIRIADERLYRAKESGRNRVVAG